MTWEYGGIYKQYDMQGVIYLPNESKVQVCDWLDLMPEFMKSADTLFTDPPWNVGNMNSFYTKADKDHRSIDFSEFTKALFSRIDEICPRYLFLEIGKEHLDIYLQNAKNRYKYVTFYNSYYYKKLSNKCYVIHATNDYKHRRYPELEDLPQSSIVAWLCKNHIYDCIGDICMGRGLVGREAYNNGKRFVGTELNLKRLAILVDFIRTEEEKRSVPALCQPDDAA